jgi:hypothetical protein
MYLYSSKPYFFFYPCYKLQKIICPYHRISITCEKFLMEIGTLLITITDTIYSKNMKPDYLMIVIK